MMVWKKVNQPTESILIKAVKVKNKPLFNSAKTRIAHEVNQQKNCKIITEKKLTKDQSNLYNHIIGDKKKKYKFRAK